ncbi:dsDNA nuclease domain-containing protein [Aliivibrio fischeri]|uniref:dsDNA nuclease domain-containing protein n=1 Tax=Aliivibrio fischeri TaxID=668 RepID=UPI0015853246|nr:dsDNA nuclease domain-containing protein [Aliivibrio fischeri]
MYQMDENNSGGVGAKKGFFFQDYVTTLFVSEMLLDNRISGVGCEVGDDIDLFHPKNIVTHVQVKTGTVDNGWNLKELKACRNLTKDKKPKRHSSVLHKSLELDKYTNLISKFMMVTDRLVKGPLCFLEIPLDNRSAKTGRDQLVKSINSALGKNFSSKNGNRGDYWVDNTLWRVFCSTELVVLQVEHNLRAASEELLNCVLTNESVKQLGEILCNRIYGKSQLCKKMHSVEDKTLSRIEAIDLLRDYALKNALLPKAYPEVDLPDIVTPLFDERVENRRKRGFVQGFNFNTYRYDHVVDMLVDWVDEVFLRPSELTSNSQAIRKSMELRSRIAQFDLKVVTSRTILNSIMRKQHVAQPIPMVMFAANNTKCLKFDSVHIVRGNDDNHELWIGVTEFIENSDDIFEVIERLCESMNELVFIDMDKDRKIILEGKDDKYLFKHDIDTILDTSNSFSSHSKRFKFVIFISYRLPSYDYQTGEDILTQEIKDKIKYMYDSMISKNPFFDQIRLGFYVFPTPCNDTILSKLKSRISS